MLQYKEYGKENRDVIILGYYDSQKVEIQIG